MDISLKYDKIINAWWQTNVTKSSTGLFHDYIIKKASHFSSNTYMSVYLVAVMWCVQIFKTAFYRTWT